MGDGLYRRGILRLLVLGYLDSNQEQLNQNLNDARTLSSPTTRDYFR